ncbi:MAG: hypothetical protein EBE86_013120 [Hormoscilla sp. GUM202]|nr:hypothetical protein [Hormoscilla sp. GUM202]
MTPSSLPIAQRSRHTGYLAIASHLGTTLGGSPSLPRGTAVFAFILTEISLMPCPYRKWRSPDRITFAIAER